VPCRKCFTETWVEKSECSNSSRKEGQQEQRDRKHVTERNVVLFCSSLAWQKLNLRMEMERSRWPKFADGETRTLKTTNKSQNNPTASQLTSQTGSKFVFTAHKFLCCADEGGGWRRLRVLGGAEWGFQVDILVVAPVNPAHHIY